jgi:hypothetical protein
MALARRLLVFGAIAFLHLKIHPPLRALLITVVNYTLTRPERVSPRTNNKMYMYVYVCVYALSARVSRSCRAYDIIVSELVQHTPQACLYYHADYNFSLCEETRLKCIYTGRDFKWQPMQNQ